MIPERIREIEGRVDALEVLEDEIAYSTANVGSFFYGEDLDNVFGDVTTLQEPFVAILNDNGAESNVWLIVGLNSTWWKVALTEVTFAAD